MPVDTSEQILAGKLPSATTEGRTLVKVATAAPGGDAWHACLRDADTESVIAAIGSLVSPGDPHKHFDAYRDAARAMVEHKLAEATVREMRRLERVGRVLAVVGIFVAIPSAILAGVQLWRIFQ